MCKNVPFINNYFEENYNIVLSDDINEMDIKIKYFQNKTDRDLIVENSFDTIQKYDFPNHLKLILKEF